MEIPQSYITSMFRSYADNVTENNYYMNGSCPICGEGKSKGKKRLYYFFNDDYLYCHNCQKSWNPYFWIKEVSGMTFKEIKEEIKEYSGEIPNFIYQVDKIEEKDWDIPDLPGQCVNLRDELQLKYYENHFIVKLALEYCKKRRLFTAINSPKTIYVCVDDFYIKNRLIIPYFDTLGKVESYISRSLLDSDKKAKYLLKFNSDKIIFNINKVDESYPHIFIFEGPIDSMFIKNGVAISGVSLTENQQKTLNYMFPFHKIVYIFDNFRKEGDEVVKKIKEKLRENETLFMYDREFSEFKDLNDYCVKNQIDSIDPSRILEGCYTGQKGLLLM